MVSEKIIAGSAPVEAVSDGEKAVAKLLAANRSEADAGCVTPSCPSETGGTCRWFGCHTSRNSVCVNHKCVCGGSQCAWKGKCQCQRSGICSGGRQCYCSPGYCKEPGTDYCVRPSASEEGTVSEKIIARSAPTEAVSDGEKAVASVLVTRGESGEGEHFLGAVVAIAFVGAFASVVWMRRSRRRIVQEPLLA